jgi:hypothetical protein
MLTQSEVQELYDYREDGNLIRRTATSGPVGAIGRVVGHYPKKLTRNNRYATTKIGGEHWCVHKLIFLWHHGYVPEQLDHINRNTLDNRIENLREANTTQNSSNRKLFANNTSGAKGVSWASRQNKWFVYVDVNKKRKNIGCFEDFELAELVAMEAREKYHGLFANHF